MIYDVATNCLIASDRYHCTDLLKRGGRGRTRRREDGEEGGRGGGKTERREDGEGVGRAGGRTGRR